jgi:EAL domain-containing protein (putative c-di-GMP-specific phosphodiesterase class I)
MIQTVFITDVGVDYTERTATGWCSATVFSRAQRPVGAERYTMTVVCEGITTPTQAERLAKWILAQGPSVQVDI